MCPTVTIQKQLQFIYDTDLYDFTTSISSTNMRANLLLAKYSATDPSQPLNKTDSLLVIRWHAVVCHSLEDAVVLSHSHERDITLLTLSYSPTFPQRLALLPSPTLPKAPLFNLTTPTHTFSLARFLALTHFLACSLSYVPLLSPNTLSHSPTFPHSHDIHLS